MNISVIGTGYVGLVSGVCFAEMGNNVLCIDNDPEKLKKLKGGEVTIYEPGLDILFERNLKRDRVRFSDDLKDAVLNNDIIFLCLPTPEGEDGSADLQYVMKVASDIGKILGEAGNKEYKVIVNKSTVPVGTAEVVTELIKKEGGDNFDVVSNPEFLREGFAVEDFMKPDRIVVGSDSEKALERMRELYASFVRQGNPILEMDTASAEVAKYASNSYLAMRITFMNELANFCEKVGADIDLVRKGLGSDTRIGKRFLFAGIGYGGSCFPKDVKALVSTSKEKGSELSILNRVVQVNENQKHVISKKVTGHFGGDIKGKHLAVWGLAFKPNTDDIRQAPSLVIIDELVSLGATISAYDPAAMETGKKVLGDKVNYALSEYDALKGADALLIFTEWNEFRNPDFAQLKSLLKEPVIFDGRNIFSLDKMEELGFVYYSIGRKVVK
ncbi:MAG: UDP-glucose/GDP-mannose dehydrogenase family protein [Ignavibacteriae bacterium]|nr:UDP-glucose/GDP-mannose dehydrogenase family protein [Ignavibacteriota bacterium]MCB9242681.1 UDP-glucose/GDP-mannose dehydrogenase family protein [Ignavibacteriales bacterium]